MRKKKRQAYKAKKIAEYYYYKKKNYKRALEQYQKALKVDTCLQDREELYYQLWNCFYNLDDNKKALLAIELGLKFSPEDVDLLESRLVLLGELWQSKEYEILHECIQKIYKRNKEIILDLDSYYNKL